MVHRTTITLAIAAALAAAALGVALFPGSRPPAVTPSDRGAPVVRLYADVGKARDPRYSVSGKSIDFGRFIDSKRFASVWSKPRGARNIDGRIVAGVVNHHFLAADLLAGFFMALRDAEPDIRRIIILSPDHFFSGRGPVSVHDRSYSTPQGSLESDRAFVASLVSSTPAVLENGAMFEAEHGVGTLAPFIRHEFPDARIVGLALQGNMDRGMARDFGKRLATLIDEGTVVIVSSDMSHYLTKAQALENDRTTIAKLISFDEEFFSSAKDDFTDNGASFIVLDGLFEALGIEPSFELLGHGISADYVSDDRVTTSYINGFWLK